MKFLYLFYLAALIYVIYEIWDRPDFNQTTRLLWTIGVLMLPGAGLLAWLMLRQRA
ncbi:MAG: PLDc N-terminal domain-containing protein [Bacteroidia bacterium]|nr:PLDc N-terminal domain-containing protein [Bacteroidia bacterium]